jgi:hypothetical protein
MHFGETYLVQTANQQVSAVVMTITLMVVMNLTEKCFYQHALVGVLYILQFDVPVWNT